MAAQQARRKRDTCQRKVSSLADQVKRLLQDTMDTSPSEITLERKNKSIDAAFSEFEAAHNAFLEHVDEADIEAEYLVYDEVLNMYTEQKDAAEILLIERQRPTLATPRMLEDLIQDKESTRSGMFTLIDESLDEVAKILDDAEQTHSRETQALKERWVVSA